MASKLDIWNMALSAAGQDELSSLTDGDQPTMVAVLSRHWDNCFLSQLQLYDWAFARQDVELEEVGTPVINDAWEYEYDLPDDCQVVRTLHADGDSEPQPFEVRLGARDPVAMQIFSNLGPAYAIFTRTIDDTSDTEMALLSDVFVYCLTLILQVPILMKLTQDPKRRRDLLELYKVADSAAKRATAAQRYRPNDVEPRAIAARR